MISIIIKLNNNFISTRLSLAGWLRKGKKIIHSLPAAPHKSYTSKIYGHKDLCQVIYLCGMWSKMMNIVYKKSPQKILQASIKTNRFLFL